MQGLGKQNLGLELEFNQKDSPESEGLFPDQNWSKIGFLWSELQQQCWARERLQSARWGGFLSEGGVRFLPWFNSGAFLVRILGIETEFGEKQRRRWKSRKWRRKEFGLGKGKKAGGLFAKHALHVEGMQLTQQPLGCWGGKRRVFLVLGVFESRWINSETTSPTLPYSHNLITHMQRQVSYLSLPKCLSIPYKQSHKHNKHKNTHER